MENHIVGEFESTDEKTILDHVKIFRELSIQGYRYSATRVAEKYGLSIDELKAVCLSAGNVLKEQGMLHTLLLPTFRWANEN